jgi:hypothetical protein
VKNVAPDPGRRITNAWCRGENGLRERGKFLLPKSQRSSLTAPVSRPADKKAISEHYRSLRRNLPGPYFARVFAQYSPVSKIEVRMEVLIIVLVTVTTAPGRSPDQTP